jgi:glucose-6-phosphate dehydrogenase assembly protein OpcA
MSSKMMPEPVLQRSWDTDTLDTGAIHDELNRLWVEVGGPRHGGQAPGEMVADSHLGGGELMRANTLNLIAVADDEDIARMITSTLSQLSDFLPSRTIIFITAPSAPRTNTWHVEVQLNEGESSGDGPAIRFETITISVDPKMGGYLASLVAPLLISELPTFLWWPTGDFIGNTLFTDIVEVVDRLILDSARLGNDARALAQMRTLMDDEDDPELGDFTWIRLQPWRQLTAQFFDPIEVQPCLDEIAQVNIAYAQHREDNGSGLAAALLIIGWLGTRLDWEVIEPMEARKSGGWTVPLIARNKAGKARDIQVRLTPDPSPDARFSLRSVEIVSVGEHQGVFRIMRTDKDDMITSSETSKAPYVSRMVYSRRKSTVEMLGDELQQFSADPVFEEAVSLATRLLPE